MHCKMTSSPTSSELSLTARWDLRDSFDKVPSWKSISCFTWFLPLEHISAQTSSLIISVKSSSLRCLARAGASWPKHCVFRQQSLCLSPSYSLKKMQRFNRRERNLHHFKEGKLRQGEVKGWGFQIIFRSLRCLIIFFLMVSELFSGSRTPMSL